MDRKIIQVEVATNHRGLYALCDDGSLWGLSDEAQWRFYPPIPQYEITKPANEEGV